MKIVDLINSNSRIEFLDVFRGFALFYMIFFHILDYLSVKSIYRSFPYYIEWIQQPTVIPPPLLFMFISGISVFIFTMRRLKKNSPFDVLKKLSLRYGKYLLVSFFFTYVMWGEGYFFGFEEALQGIAVSAIFLGAMIVLFDKKNWEKSFIPLILFMSLIRHFFSYSQFNFYGVYEIFYNFLVSGWFSLFNIAPLMLGGALFAKHLANDDNEKMFTFSSLLLFLTLMLHSFFGGGSSIFQISYGMMSFNFTLFSISVAGVVLSIIKYITSNYDFKVLYFLKEYGFASYENYIFHHIFIVLPIIHFGFLNSVNNYLSLVFAFLLSIVSYIISKVYLKFFKKYKSNFIDPIFFLLLIWSFILYFII